MVFPETRKKQSNTAYGTSTYGPIADHAIKSCHQSHSLPVPAVGRGGGLGKRGGWPSWAGGTVAAAQALCARVPAGRGARGAGQAPCLLYTSPSPRDRTRSRMPSSA